jgi:hypothetical protein
MKFGFCFGSYENTEKTERTSWFCYLLGYRSKTRTLPENKTVVESYTVECLPPLCCGCISKTDRDGVKTETQDCCSLIWCFCNEIKEDTIKGKKTTDLASCCIPCGRAVKFDIETIPKATGESKESVNPGETASNEAVIVQVRESAISSEAKESL